jgi:hypothetical protein
VEGWGATVTHEGLMDLEDERTYAVSYDEGGTMTALTGEALKRHCSFSFACVWIPGMKVLITHCYCIVCTLNNHCYCVCVDPGDEGMLLR